MSRIDFDQTRGKLLRIVRDISKTDAEVAAAQAALAELNDDALARANAAFENATPFFARVTEKLLALHETAAETGDGATMAISLEALQTAGDNRVAALSLPQDDEPKTDELVPAPAPPPAGAPPPPVTRSKALAKLAAEYQATYDAAEIDADKVGTVDWAVGVLDSHKAQYQEVGQEVGVPWHFIGIVHAMETGFRFSRHLHNGDDLKARTVHVPKGRPLAGTPPFTWKASAIDALKKQKLDQVGAGNWDLVRTLYEFERYNGWGYRNHGVNSAYLWSFSSAYTGGKYVADGVWSATARSKQIGAAVMLKRAQEKGVVAI